MKMDGDKWRRVVASPLPKRVFEIRPMKWLLEKGTIVIAAGGGGIPTVYEPGRVLRGIEVVIDKALCSELLARELEADVFIMATDADAVFLDWGKPTARAFRRASPQAMRDFKFPAGSMGPKVDAACRFAETSQKRCYRCTERLASDPGRKGGDDYYVSCVEHRVDVLGTGC